MGMFDDIKFEINCPKCGERVTGFQSKDGPCRLLTLEYWEVDNFYSSCNKCGAWIDFTRKEIPPRQPIPIDEYEMEIDY